MSGWRRIFDRASVDRLYADLERALRELNEEELTKAQAEIAALQRTPSIRAHMVAKTMAELQSQASQVLKIRALSEDGSTST